MQRLMQIRLAIVEPQLDGFERGVSQALIDQNQLAQIGGWNVERARRIRDIGVVANERRGDNLNVQMCDEFGNPLRRQRHVKVLHPWRDQRHACDRR